MKFYDREEELDLLKTIEDKSKKRSYMTLIYGRRRVGKTRLIQQHFKNRKFLYFFAAKKADSLLARDFQEEIKQKFDIDIYGTPENTLDIMNSIFCLLAVVLYVFVFDLPHKSNLPGFYVGLL